MPETPETVIIGAGLAGLAAGCTLLRQTKGAMKVRIFERGHLIGGKATSKAHRVDGETYHVDHGLHLFFDYPNFGKLLDDSAPGWRSRLRPATDGALFFRDGRPPIRVRPWRLPSPLHLAAAYRVALGEPSAALGFARLLIAALLIRPERLTLRDRIRLDQMSFAEYAESLGISSRALAEEFARVAERSTFNFPFPTSALAMLLTMRLVQQNHRAQTPSYIDGPCQEVLITPLRRWFEANGGTIEIFKAVKRIQHDGTRVQHLEIAPPPESPHHAEQNSAMYSNFHSTVPDGDGATDRETADHFISAVPAGVVCDFLDVQDPLRAHRYFADIAALTTTKTVACQIHYDRVVSTPEQRGLGIALPTPFSSVLDRAGLWTGDHDDGRSVLEFVGEAETVKARTDEELVEMARTLARQIYPGVAGAKERRVWLHRTKHDPYFVTTTGSDALRPTACTPLENLYLAGDYAAHSFGVVTMEGAVVSGIEAANQLLRHIGRAGREVLPMSAPGGLIEPLRRVLHATGTFALFTGFDEIA